MNRIMQMLKNSDSITYYDKSLNRFVDSKIDDSCIPYVSLSKLEQIFKMYEDELRLSVPKVIMKCDSGDVKIIYPISNSLKSYLKANIAGERFMMEQDKERELVHKYLITAYQTILDMIEEQEKELENI